MLSHKLEKIYEQRGNQTDPLCVLWIEDSLIWSEVMGKEPFDAAYHEIRTRYRSGALTELCALRPNLANGALAANTPEVVRIQSYAGLKLTIASRRFDLVIADLNILEVDPQYFDPESDLPKYCPPIKLAELLEPLNFYVPVLLMTSGGSPNSANARLLRQIESKFEGYTGSSLRDKLLFLKDSGEPKEKLQSKLFDLLLIALQRDWQSFLDEESPARKHKALESANLPLLDIDNLEKTQGNLSFLAKLVKQIKFFAG